jgi:hypothetical protein
VERDSLGESSAETEHDADGERGAVDVAVVAVLSDDAEATEETEEALAVRVRGLVDEADRCGGLNDAVREAPRSGIEGVALGDCDGPGTEAVNEAVTEPLGEREGVIERLVLRLEDTVRVSDCVGVDDRLGDGDCRCVGDPERLGDCEADGAHPTLTAPSRTPGKLPMLVHAPLAAAAAAAAAAVSPPLAVAVSTDKATPYSPVGLSGDVPDPSDASA